VDTKGDVVDALSRDAARKIVHAVMQTPASGDLSVLRTRIQAFVRHALVSAVQSPDPTDTRSFRLMARGVLREDPAVFSRRCVGFSLVGTDHMRNTGTREETVAWFLAFDRVARTIAKEARLGTQLEVAAWVRTNRWPREPGERHSELTFEVESVGGIRPGVADT
jgi:hypothetical protein